MKPIRICICSCLIIVAFCIVSCTQSAKKDIQVENLSKTSAKELKLPLPTNVEWEQTTNDEHKEKNVVEYIVRGTTPLTTPARILHQRLNHSYEMNQLKEKMLMPLEKCSESDVKELGIAGKFQKRLSLKTMCSQFVGYPYGLIDYITFLVDENETHIILAEIRIQPSKTLDSLILHENVDQKWLDQTIAFSEMFEKMTEKIDLY